MRHPSYALPPVTYDEPEERVVGVPHEVPEVPVLAQQSRAENFSEFPVFSTGKGFYISEDQGRVYPFCLRYRIVAIDEYSYKYF